jgi:ABC-type lipoprotein release transport system permease subunit
MIEDAVRVASGHVSVSGDGYLETRTLEQFVRLDAPLVAALDGTAGVEGWAPRVVSFGLLSRDSSTKGVAILGVDPDRERAVSTLADRVKQGRFVTAGGAREIVLGQRLAENLSAQVGDELLLYSVAYSLETAYDLFQVVGILRVPNPEMDRSLAVVSLADAQDFYVYGDRVSEVAVLAGNADRAPAIRDSLERSLASVPAEVHTWNETMPELVQFIFLDDAGMYIMLAILVIVVGFGILNTILMAVLERKREFGVLLALGLRPRSVFRIVYLESLLLAAVGLAIGLVVALPLVLYFQANPITVTSPELIQTWEVFGVEPQLTWKLKPLNPLGSTLTILGVALVAALYPALKASRGRPVDVLRSL